MALPDSSSSLGLLPSLIGSLCFWVEGEIQITFGTHIIKHCHTLLKKLHHNAQNLKLHNFSYSESALNRALSSLLIGSLCPCIERSILCHGRPDLFGFRRFYWKLSGHSYYTAIKQICSEAVGWLVIVSRVLRLWGNTRKNILLIWVVEWPK